MTSAERLAALKIDLGIVATAYDSRLSAYLETALQEMTREGVTDDGTAAFDTCVIQYAAWMWRKRDTGEGMPRMLRYWLNNFKLDQHVNGEGGENNG